MTELLGSWYDYPTYYDIAMQADTRREMDFIVAVWKKHGVGRMRRILEPGCGTGRLVAAAAARGYKSAGFDTSQPALEYLRKRLARRRLKAEIAVADLENFRADRPFDCVHCLINTFRHLRTRNAARRHLQAAAAALRTGGVYLLGLHLFPCDADPFDSENWKQRRGRIAVETAFTVVRHDWESRTEWIRVVMRIRHGAEKFVNRSWMPLRLWNATDLQELLAEVPELELVGTYDFNYDVDDPAPFDEYASDLVLVFTRR